MKLHYNQLHHQQTQVQIRFIQDHQYQVVLHVHQDQQQVEHKVQQQ